jgi:ribosome-associated protein
LKHEPATAILDSSPASGGQSARNQEDYVLSIQTQAAKTAGTKAAVMAAQTQPTSEELLARILTSLDDDKAEDVVQIDLRGKTAIGDYMIIASGRSTRQVAAMSEKMVDRLKQEYGMSCKIEGKDAGDWVLIDTGDVIVHIFRPEVREFYQLEKMWLPTSSTAAN